MLYAASDPSAAIGTALDVERTRFAPAPDLLRKLHDRRISPDHFDRAYRAQLRTFYRTDPDIWIDLAHQAAVQDVTLVSHPSIARTLFECLSRVGADRGLLLDPHEDDLGAALIEARHLALQQASGQPLPHPADPHFLPSSTMPNRKSFR